MALKIKYKLGRYILAAWLMLCLVSANGQITEQNAKYQVNVWGMDIGEFSVKQEKGQDGALKVEAVTDVKVKLLFNYQVKYTQQSCYKNGNLLSFHVQTIKNGEVNSDTRLEKTWGGYLLIKDGDSTYVHENITYSGSLLYFNEPSGISSIYKERSGETQQIKCVDRHTYVITDEKDKKTNEYKYKGGILNQAALIHPIATIHLERFL